MPTPVQNNPHPPAPSYQTQQYAVHQKARIQVEQQSREASRIAQEEQRRAPERRPVQQEPPRTETTGNIINVVA